MIPKHSIIILLILTKKGDVLNITLTSSIKKQYGLKIYFKIWMNFFQVKPSDNAFVIS